MPRVKGIKKEKQEKNIIQQSGILLYSIKKYYNRFPKSFEMIRKIVNNEIDIKVALIEYFVTIYSKKHKSSCDRKDGLGQYFFYDEYKNQLKSYGKVYFDPFKRKNKFKFDFEEQYKKELVTTIAQLNFMKWCCKENVLKYIVENYKVIESEFVVYQKSKKIKKENKKTIVKDTKITSVEIEDVSLEV